MRYLDTGSRDPNHALGSWLASEKPSEVIAMRFQAGFFGIDGLSPATPLLEKLRNADEYVGAVVGSNDGDTLRDDLALLLDVLGAPRANAHAAVVSFSNGLFHPKVYHLSRSDNSQVAYVGSANLTYRAVTSLNVEAGILVDTREGDPDAVLSAISNSIDAWFSGKQPGARSVSSVTDIDELVAEGIASVATAPSPPTGSGPVSSGSTKPSLVSLVKFARLKKPKAPAAAPSQTIATGPTPRPAPAPVSAPTPASALPVVTKSPPYPGYVLFEPGATKPTSGAGALTGTPLPAGALGIILRLNRDSARHFENRTGTANISIPVPTLSSIRFGVFKGKYERPRAEFELVCRLVHSTGQHVTAAADTGVMVYGFSPGESGHGDVRLVLPAAPAREIRDFAKKSGLRVPEDGDAFLLEWPTTTVPQFKMTFFDIAVSEFANTETALSTAVAAGNVVGQSACWLPKALVPA